jgi:hypothetical protein
VTTGGYLKNIPKKTKMNRTWLLPIILLLYAFPSPVPTDRDGYLSTGTILAF